MINKTIRRPTWQGWGEKFPAPPGPPPPSWTWATPVETESVGDEHVNQRNTGQEDNNQAAVTAVAALSTRDTHDYLYSLLFRLRWNTTIIIKNIYDITLTNVWCLWISFSCTRNNLLILYRQGVTENLRTYSPHFLRWIGWATWWGLERSKSCSPQTRCSQGEQSLDCICGGSLQGA